MHGSIDDSLEALHASKDLESELLVVRICIQLLLHGSTLRCGFYQLQARNVAKKLKAHKIVETVKDLHVIEVLEVHNSLYVKETD